MSSSTVLALVIAVIGAGIFTYIRDAVRWFIRRHKDSDPEVVEERKVREAVRQADESLLVVVRSRVELVADNQRLREERAELETRHAAERAEWIRERAALRQDIEDMEARLRSALDDLSRLRVRHGLTDDPA